MPPSNCGRLTPNGWSAKGTLICCITRMSAKTTLDASKPAAGCRTNEKVLAMRQPVRTHTWACSRCAAARLHRYDSSLQVCHASSCALPAMHGSQYSDHDSCARAAGSCSASSSIIRRVVRNRPHVGGALGERGALGVLVRPLSGQRQPTAHAWPRVHGVKPLAGSCGERLPTFVGRMDALMWLCCLA